MIQRFNQVRFAKGVKHYTRDGKLYTGPTHMHNGRLMTGATHSSYSEYLYHESELAEVGPKGGIRKSDKAPDSDTPNKNPKGEGTAGGDASGKRGAKVTAEQEKTLQKKVDDFNERESNTKNGRATLGALKSVFQRGLGAYNTSRSPLVKSAEQWAYARVNAFLYLLKNGRPENAKYTTDYDLLPKGHPKAEMSAEFDSEEFRFYKVLNRELPVYDIVIDLDDEETTVSFNSLVSDPAHEKNFETFAKKVSYNFNDEEQMITGVAISANTPIFRRDPLSGEEYYVNFSKQAIKDIVFDYARKENFNNVNLEHDSNRVVNGIYMTMSYIIDEENGFTAPKRFENETDGSWIVGYKVTDKKVYEAAKDGLFNGFSIEGVFLLLDTGKGFDHEFMQIYEELKKVQEYITFYNDYPEAVTNNAKKGIELNQKYGNKCATRVGRLRATTLANRQTVSVAVIKRMYSYLSRAETYYDESDESACGTISFLLWGGLAGKRWSEAKLKELGIFEQ